MLQQNVSSNYISVKRYKKNVNKNVDDNDIVKIIIKLMREITILIIIITFLVFTIIKNSINKTKSIRRFYNWNKLLCYHVCYLNHLQLLYLTMFNIKSSKILYKKLHLKRYSNVVVFQVLTREDIKYYLSNYSVQSTIVLKQSQNKENCPFIMRQLFTYYKSGEVLVGKTKIILILTENIRSISNL